jgi:hypothetical protein
VYIFGQIDPSVFAAEAEVTVYVNTVMQKPSGHVGMRMCI